MQLSPTYTKIQWGIILLVLLIDVIWISVSSFNIYLTAKMIALVSWSIVTVYIVYIFYKLFRPDPKIMLALLSTFFFLSFIAVACVLSYLCLTTNFPLVDESLARWDTYFGFQSLDLVLWFQAHKWWNLSFALIYASYYPQIAIIFIYFCFFENTNNIQRFIVLFMISTLLTIFASIFFPALPTYAWHHYPIDQAQASTIKSILDLRKNILNFNELNGVIEFPSFHTTIALINIYIFRNHRKMILIPVFVLNSLMVFSCLSNGGHYLVDIFGGIFIFLIAIVIEYYLFQIIKQHEFKEKRSPEISKELMGASSSLD